MAQLTTRPQAGSGRERRANDAAAQQRALKAMGVQISLEELKALPRGAWIRLVPEARPSQVTEAVRDS
jgi:hypothetical protein